MTFIELAIILLALGLSALFSGSEIGLYCLSPLRLRFRAERGDRHALRLQHYLHDRSRTIVAILVGNNIANFAVTVTFTGIIARKHVLEPEIVSAVILTPLIFLFCEALPKKLFQQRADVLTYRVEGVLSLARILFYPIIVILSGITKLISLLFHKHIEPSDALFTRQSVRSFIRESKGTITPYQSQITQNIMALHHRSLRDAMIPMEHVSSIDINAMPRQLEDLMRKVRYSRFPVTEGTRSNVVGMLNIFDYLYETEHGDSIRKLVRPALYLPVDLPIHVAMHRMQSARILLGVVVDPQNRALGIVALKDLLEEIVGELVEA